MNVHPKVDDIRLLQVNTSPFFWCCKVLKARRNARKYYLIVCEQVLWQKSLPCIEHARDSGTTVTLSKKPSRTTVCKNDIIRNCPLKATKRAYSFSELQTCHSGIPINAFGSARKPR